jgi:hypothetical protein
MRILLDECVPRPLRLELPEHEVRTVVEIGWSGKKNGELLRLMILEGFSVLLTADRNIGYQQNMQTIGAAVVILMARSNRLRDLVPLMPAARAALATIQPGNLIHVQA